MIFKSNIRSSRKIIGTDEHFILDVDKEVLEEAEGIENDSRAGMTSYEWGNSVYEYYGYTLYGIK